jgi:tetratricopeptide (TPR) repeat protein
MSAVVPAAVRILWADRILRSEKTVEAYTRALAWNPENAEYWWLRGRLRHYSVADADLPGAIGDYERAVRLDPRHAQSWLDLAFGLEQLNADPARAEAAVETALALRPFSPLTHWQAGNFYLRRGRLARMYRSFRAAAAYDPEKLAIALDLAWRVDPDRAHILEELVPDVLSANLAYLAFLAERDELDLAEAAWKRSLDNPVPRGLEFAPAAVFPYVDRLLAADRARQAWTVWQEALRKAGLDPAPPAAGSGHA